MRLPPISLYVHFPWCERKCPYCDFNSHEVTGDINESAYVNQLLADLSYQIPWLSERKIQSIFIGGGTPSLFSPRAIELLLGGIRQKTPLESNAEITLEANPGSVDANKFAGYLDAGVNRLSLGVQSFQNSKLAALGRIHTASEAHRAIEIALDTGFSNLNIDLMHGLPEQTVEDALLDLDQAVSAGVCHISWYQLTIEPRTLFARNPPHRPGEDVLADIEDKGLARLLGAGYTRYEISAFAHTGSQCRHNLNYWHFGDYLGIGAGAHGKITDPATNQILRTAKPRQPRLYMSNDVSLNTKVTPVPPDARAGEFMLNALRLLDGVDPGSFKALTNVALESIKPKIDRYRNLCLWQEDRLGLTARGLRYLDSIVAEFI